MDKSEREELLRRAEQIRKKAYANADAQFRESEVAIERVFELSQQTSPPTIAQLIREFRSKPVNGHPKSKDRGLGVGPAQLVRSAISQMEEFSTPVISEYIQRTTPDRKIDRAAISSVLNKMKMSGEIIQTSDGAGRMPHSYKKSDAKQ